MDHAEDHREKAGLDPHIWLSPPLVKIQARTLLAALLEVDPEHRGVYEANFKAFTTQIDQLDADLKKAFTGKTGLQFMVFHPAWGYFAHAYGLKQVPIGIEGKGPKPAQMKELIQHAREYGSRLYSFNPDFQPKARNSWHGKSAVRWRLPILWPKTGWLICVRWPLNSKRSCGSLKHHLRER